MLRMPLGGWQCTYGPSLNLAVDNIDAAHIRLLRNQEGTDFTITCGAREYKVHRLVLSMHSDVLSRACNGAFKVLLATSC